MRLRESWNHRCSTRVVNIPRLIAVILVVSILASWTWLNRLLAVSSPHETAVSTNPREHQLPKKRLLIVSPGGVGSTYIMMELARSLRNEYTINDWRDFDGLKHGFSSPEYWARVLHGICSNGKPCGTRYFGLPDRILYILGDPMLALFSHLRRGTASIVRRSMNSFVAPSLSAHDDRWALWASGLNQETLQAYARMLEERDSQGLDDGFGLMQHFQSWSQCIGCPQGISIMFADLSYLAMHADELSRFLDVDKNKLQYIEEKGRTAPDPNLIVPLAVRQLFRRISDLWQRFNGRVTTF